MENRVRSYTGPYVKASVGACCVAYAQVTDSEQLLLMGLTLSSTTCMDPQPNKALICIILFSV